MYAFFSSFAPNPHPCQPPLPIGTTERSAAEKLHSQSAERANRQEGLSNFEIKVNDSIKLLVDIFKGKVEINRIEESYIAAAIDQVDSANKYLKQKNPKIEQSFAELRAVVTNITPDGESETVKKIRENIKKILSIEETSRRSSPPIPISTEGSRKFVGYNITRQLSSQFMFIESYENKAELPDSQKIPSEGCKSSNRRNHDNVTEIISF